MSLETQAAMAAHPTFRKRVQAAMAKAAEQILGEPAATANRDERHALGTRILLPDGISRYTDVFARMVAANPTIGGASDQSEVADNDIEFAVVSVWDDIAGVKAPETP